jgi:hypothetical protein
MGSKKPFPEVQLERIDKTKVNSPMKEFFRVIRPENNRGMQK